MGDENLEAWAGLLGTSGIPLGFRFHKDTGEWLTDFQRPLFYNGDRHIVTFGPTGSGKNTTSQTPALVEYDASALVIDVKGQLGAVTAGTRIAAFGHKVAFLNPFAAIGFLSVSYNPLSHLDPDSLSFASDCRRIAEGLVDLSKGDHWEMSALDVVELLIMWTRLYEHDKSLVRVRQLLNLPDDMRIELFKEMMDCENATIAEGAARYISDAKEVRDCIQTAVVQLGFLRDPAIEKVLQGGPDEISFAELKRRKMTVFLIIPPELLHTHGKFLRLIVLSALGELIRETAKPEKPVLFMLDEFAQLGHMSIIENAASIVRDYQIRLWLILQNLPQLKALYGNKWESFLSSAGVIQFFTPNDLETAEYISKRSGTRTEMRKSVSASTSSGTAGSGGSTSSSESYSETEVPFLTVHNIFGACQEVQFLICPNLSKLIIAGRAPYWQQKQLIGFMHDPYHLTAQEREDFEIETRTGTWIGKREFRFFLKRVIDMKLRDEIAQELPNKKAVFRMFKDSSYAFGKSFFSKKVAVITSKGGKTVFKNETDFLKWAHQEIYDARIKDAEKTLEADTDAAFNDNAESLKLVDW